MDMLLGWFDLNGVSAPIGPVGGPQLSLFEQVLLYIVVVAGVVLSEAVAMARSGSPVRIELSRSWLAVACLIALVAFPAVWREIGSMAPAAPGDPCAFLAGSEGMTRSKGRGGRGLGPLNPPISF